MIAEARLFWGKKIILSLSPESHLSKLATEAFMFLFLRMDHYI